MTLIGKIAALMAMQAMAYMSVGKDSPTRSSNEVSGIKHKPIPRGCHEYTIDGITVIALNEKSAKKKVKNMLKSAKK